MPEKKLGRDFPLAPTSNASEYNSSDSVPRNNFKAMLESNKAKSRELRAKDSISNANAKANRAATEQKMKENFKAMQEKSKATAREMRTKDSISNANLRAKKAENDKKMKENFKAMLEKNKATAREMRAKRGGA
jgi:hypothetical protein